MYSLNGRKVTLARLHSTIHIAGVGQIGPALDRTSKGQLQLTLCEQGVHAKGKGPTGINVEFVVPIANCQSIELERQTDETSN